MSDRHYRADSGEASQYRWLNCGPFRRGSNPKVTLRRVYLKGIKLKRLARGGSYYFTKISLDP